MNQSQPWGATAPPPPPPREPSLGIGQLQERPAPGPAAIDVEDQAAEVPFGVPSSAAGLPATEWLDPKPGMNSEEIARAWVSHIKLVAADFRGVLSVLPHGAVTNVLAEAGDVVAAIARGL